MTLDEGEIHPSCYQNLELTGLYLRTKFERDQSVNDRSKATLKGFGYLFACVFVCLFACLFVCLLILFCFLLFYFDEITQVEFSPLNNRERNETSMRVNRPLFVCLSACLFVCAALFSSVLFYESA